MKKTDNSIKIGLTLVSILQYILLFTVFNLFLWQS